MGAAIELDKEIARLDAPPEREIASDDNPLDRCLHWDGGLFHLYPRFLRHGVDRHTTTDHPDAPSNKQDEDGHNEPAPSPHPTLAQEALRAYERTKVRVTMHRLMTLFRAAHHAGCAKARPILASKSLGR